MQPNKIINGAIWNVTRKWVSSSSSPAPQSTTNFAANTVGSVRRQRKRGCVRRRQKQGRASAGDRNRGEHSAGDRDRVSERAAGEEYRVSERSSRWNKMGSSRHSKQQQPAFCFAKGSPRGD
ncbi:hypothetical protein Fot_24313 [Forsythia ovata]|uniref:Uncharacterized protein n=1 Tax=Forsythia ovata TaxID=205694 RepID=A0ABD1U5X1_9LAMI